MLREQLETLAVLQGIDLEVKEHKDAQTERREEMESRDRDITKLAAEVKILRESWEERDRVRRDKEHVIHDASRKATDKRMRMSHVKNLKELQALQREIGVIKESNAILEEELLEVMTDLEEQERVLKEKEEELNALQNDWNERKGPLEREIAELEHKIDQTRDQRAATASRLNDDLVGRYELLFNRRGGTAVVEVSSAICQACYMNLPPQLWNEVLRNERVNLCPSCQRILFYNPPAPEPGGQP
ncbi:MAG: C4-type zinc ribbon domain-containing protein [Deltaproteobacteria bacterium]|nr:C4-type zinc ribbon domain-containing protein [Deltaproteobacteria bacterium]